MDLDLGLLAGPRVVFLVLLIFILEFVLIDFGVIITNLKGLSWNRVSYTVASAL